MLRFIKFFQGYLFVVIGGYSPERFLNLCGSQNIVLWNLQPAKDGYSFYISLKAFRLLRPLLKKTGTHIRIKKRCGLPFLMFRYRKHRFFLLGIICAFAILFLMSRFIWKVEITGNSFYSGQVITDFLEDSGVGYGVLKRKTDCGEIENLLRNHFPDITWVSARISGTRLYLIVQERIAGAEDKTGNDAPADLLSDCEGTVVSVTTRRGTPLVEKGDPVENGTVLVSGRIELTDDSGEVAENSYVRADADVLIRTAIPYEAVLPRTFERAVDTGKKRYRIRLIFRNHRIGIGANKPDNGTWDASTRVFPVRAGADFYLPFQISVTRYEQYEWKQFSYSDSGLEQKMKDDLDRYQKNLTENGIQILENNVMIDKNDREGNAHGSLTVIKKADQFRVTDPSVMREEKNGADTADHGDSD